MTPSTPTAREIEAEFDRDHAIDSGGWCRTCECSAHVCQKHMAECFAAAYRAQQVQLEAMAGVVATVARFISNCDCHEAYKDRGLVAPDCCAHSLQDHFNDEELALIMSKLPPTEKL